MEEWQWACRGDVGVVGGGRQAQRCWGRRAAASGLKREVTIIMLLGGGGGGKAQLGVGHRGSCHATAMRGLWQTMTSLAATRAGRCKPGWPQKSLV